jgi:hypothetical protein
MGQLDRGISRFVVSVCRLRTFSVPFVFLGGSINREGFGEVVEEVVVIFLTVDTGDEPRNDELELANSIRKDTRIRHMGVAPISMRH